MPPTRQNAEFSYTKPRQSPYPINIMCLNGDLVPAFSHEVNASFFTDRHTIALWWWEVVDAFPPDWHDAFEYLDEVWVATDQIYDAIAPHSPVPVNKVRMPVVMPRVGLYSRARLGMPEDGFIFLYVYDYHSTAARKNPVGHVEAFKAAFGEGSGAKLVLKCINGDRMTAEHTRTLLAVGDHPDITVIDRFVSADEKNAIVAACDCYVSLHRSEGFGLTPAEAMALGKPVIATRYGGTLDFMTDQNSYLVDHGWTKVGPGAHPYPAGRDVGRARPRPRGAADARGLRGPRRGAAPRRAGAARHPRAPRPRRGRRDDARPPAGDPRRPRARRRPGDHGAADRLEPRRHATAHRDPDPGTGRARPRGEGAAARHRRAPDGAVPRPPARRRSAPLRRHGGAREPDHGDVARGRGPR